MRDEWDKSSPPCFDGLKKDEYYLILHNMLQYYTILQTYTEILQSKMESSSSRVVILSKGTLGRTFR